MIWKFHVRWTKPSVIAMALICTATLTVTASIAASGPYNEMPMYDSQPRPPSVVEADERFFAAVAASGLTRPQGSDQMVALGWVYYSRKDYATAMKRFNQAWLLDPDNGDSFQGFALVVMERDGDVAQAGALFKQGFAKPRQSHRFFVGYGAFLLLANRPTEAVAPLQKAIAFPDVEPEAQALLTLAQGGAVDPKAVCAEMKKNGGTLSSCKDF